MDFATWYGMCGIVCLSKVLLYRGGKLRSEGFTNISEDGQRMLVEHTRRKKKILLNKLDELDKKAEKFLLD
jgi:SLT domain-containing protein